MKYYLIAGEASGDLHGSNLMKEIKRKDATAEFRFWGGDKMKEVGGKLVKHYKDLAFMGFLEVALNLRTILNNIKFCKKDIANYKPDCIIFIDYPGFNLRILPFAKEHNLKTFYYISPQLWAWKAGRVKTIKQFVDKMFVILPFEKQWYKNYNYEVDFVGHPLLDAIKNISKPNRENFLQENNLTNKPIIALLPGSRNQEISIKLPIMLSIEKHFPDYQFVVAGAPSKTKSEYEKLIGKKLHIVENKTYDLLQISDAALVTSGTATLETALLNVPEVVCYKGSWISYQIGKRLVKHIKYISLVNLIMDEEVVTELIQEELNEENLKNELQKILNKNNRNIIQEKYKIMKEKLGGEGASQRTAQLILENI